MHACECGRAHATSTCVHYRHDARAHKILDSVLQLLHRDRAAPILTIRITRVRRKPSRTALACTAMNYGYRPVPPKYSTVPRVPTGESVGDRRTNTEMPKPLALPPHLQPPPPPPHTHTHTATLAHIRGAYSRHFLQPCSARSHLVPLPKDLLHRVSDACLYDTPPASRAETSSETSATPTDAIPPA